MYAYAKAQWEVVRGARETKAVTHGSGEVTTPPPRGFARGDAKKMSLIAGQLMSRVLYCVPS